MKKYFMLMVLAIVSLTAWADAEVKSGSLKDLKTPDARVLVTWDYSQMLIEDKKPEDFLREKGPDWERDYPAEVSACEATFDIFFNKKDKKFAQITDDEDAAQYEMIIHVDSFHYGSLGAAIAFGGFARGAHIEGTVDVVKLSDKSKLAVISFECSGKAAYSNEQRRTLAYYDLAQDIVKLIKKAK
ncbi:MAG: hypothetical protein NC418_03580 [Muribaculaceae bacterium]|nr:hypothetical protein [Muribaculaceae bacterium]